VTVAVFSKICLKLLFDCVGGVGDLIKFSIPAPPVTRSA